MAAIVKAAQRERWAERYQARVAAVISNKAEAARFSSEKGQQVLADALAKAAARFDRQLAKVMERAAAALQPVIILCMAGMVGVMAWMMISVVYSTLANLRQH